jgi:hypothetical protein
MPQPIGNNTYQIYARNSAGVYSNPISVTVNVQECGGITNRLVVSTDASLRVLTETGAVIFSNITVSGVNLFRSIIKTNDLNKIAVFGTDFSLANPKISLLNPSTGQITGTYSPATSGTNLALGSDNNLYFCTITGVEKISITSSTPTTISSLTTTTSNFAVGAHLVSAGNKLYRFVNNKIEIIDVSTFTLLETVTIPATTYTNSAVAKADGSLIYFIGGVPNGVQVFNTSTKAITVLSTTPNSSGPLFLDTPETNLITQSTSGLLYINTTTGVNTNIVTLPSAGGLEYRKSTNTVYFAPTGAPGTLTKRDLTSGVNTQLLNLGQVFIFNILAI